MLSNFPRATKVLTQLWVWVEVLFLDTALLFHCCPHCHLPNSSSFYWVLTICPLAFGVSGRSTHVWAELGGEASSGRGGVMWGRRSFGGCVNCLFMTISWEPLLMALRVTNRRQLEQGEGEEDHYPLFNCSGGCASVSWEKGHVNPSTLYIAWRNKSMWSRSERRQETCESKQF